MTDTWLDRLQVSLVFLVVYLRPRDYPWHVVVRAQWINMDGEIEVAPVACLYGTITEAMQDCDGYGLTWLPRQRGDDPHIFGTWL
jgi:hypothetical protein